MKSLLFSICKYRHFIFSSIRNEYAVRFSRSQVGLAWVFIGPLIQAAMFTLIFSGILSARLPGIESSYAYILYLLSGLMAWNLFSEVVTRCTSLFVEQGNLIKKISFPKVTLVGTVVGISTVNNLAIFLIALILALILKPGLAWFIFWLVPLYTILFALALGLGLILGVINVFIRDIGLSLPIALQLLFWATPVIYPINILPESVRPFIEANPLCSIISGFHNLLVYGKSPDVMPLLGSFFLAALLLALALYLFRKASPEMADAL